MRFYPFAKISARCFPTIADLNNPWIFPADVAVVISVTPHYEAKIVEALKVKGVDFYHFPLEEEVDDIGWGNVKRAVEILLRYDKEDKRMVVHCDFGQHRSRLVVEAFYYAKYGEHFTDEYKGFANHLIYDCMSHHLPELSVVEKELQKMVDKKSIGIYGEPYAGDTRFVAACRERQSIYRAMIGEAIRPYQGRDREYYFGNLIADGQSSGANFLEEYIFLYARYRVAYKKPYETINSDRLFNNLLSSQPMAFNLFCPLIKMVRESPEFATQAIKSALPNYPIDRVTEVDLEFIPDNYAQLTGDRSAMDAIIRFVDTEGKAGFIAIETKYSENLGTNEASKKERALAAISTLRCFRADVEEKIRLGEIKLTQIYRNFLLSECYGRNIRANSYSLILSPHNHPSTQKEVASLAGNLSPDFKDKLQSVSLEQFVNSLIANSPAPFRATFEKFYNRYLDIKF